MTETNWVHNELEYPGLLLANAQARRTSHVKLTDVLGRDVVISSHVPARSPPGVDKHVVPVPDSVGATGGAPVRANKRLWEGGVPPPPPKTGKFHNVVNGVHTHTLGI